MNEANIEKRSVWGSLKSDIELYLFYRRYQNAMRGKLLWEEKITWAFTQLITKVAASWRNFVKRSVDVFCACVGLTVAAPVMALIAAAIKLDSKGPILFMQTRVGLKGRVFDAVPKATVGLAGPCALHRGGDDCAPRARLGAFGFRSSRRRRTGCGNGLVERSNACCARCGAWQWLPKAWPTLSR